MASISNASDTVLKSRIEDTVRLCEKRGAPCFLGFLDEREQALTASWLRKCCPQGSWSLFGGHYSFGNNNLFNGDVTPHTKP